MSPLAARLVDDAAMFPPGNADATEALAAHLRYRQGSLGPYVGPLLVHTDRLAEIAEALAGANAPALEVVLIGAHELPTTVPAGLRVVGFERHVADVPLPAATRGLPLACEISPDAAGARVLEAIASARADGVEVVAKLRTGGTRSSAFPDEQMVASVIARAVCLAVPLKFTAGLHHAVRFTATDTGFEHHGFVNLLVAIDAAQRGETTAALTDVLRVRDGRQLTATVSRWSDDDVLRVRRTFVSFGCCGVEDPLRDLVGLGLVPAATMQSNEELR